MKKRTQQISRSIQQASEVAEVMGMTLEEWLQEKIDGDMHLISVAARLSKPVPDKVVKMLKDYLQK
jgi:hypothetical protein